ncbi:MAG TPA: alpha/beta hydrolase family protein [Gemmatimonadaceae bacterium]
MSRSRFPTARLVLAAPAILATVAAALAAPRAASAQARHGSVSEQTFRSPALGVSKHFVLYLPPSYQREPSRRYPVLYYLHGLSGGEGDWLTRANVSGVADSLAALGAGEAIIVLPDGDDGWYSDWPAPVPYARCADTVHTEAPERFCVERQRYDAYIAGDLVRYVDAHWRTLASRAHRAIAGLSMGGYGAIAIALRHPAEFLAAASHSGVVSPFYAGGKPFAPPPRYAWSMAQAREAKVSFLDRYALAWGSDSSAWRANDPATLAGALVARGVTLPALFMDCGADDPFIDQNRALHWELTRLGVAHHYAEWPGTHNWRYWSAHLPESMAWLLEKVAGE